MKALSIRQPWASLLALGIKDIENRSWGTRYRGKVLIHAGKGMLKSDIEAAQQICLSQGIPFPPIETFERGGIVGIMEITDSVTKSDSPWFFGPNGFTVKNQRSCKLHPFTGRLSFFETDLEPKDLKWRKRK